MEQVKKKKGLAEHRRAIERAIRAQGGFSSNILGLTLWMIYKEHGPEAADKVWADYRYAFKSYGFPDTPPSTRFKEEKG